MFKELAQKIFGDRLNPAIGGQILQYMQQNRYHQINNYTGVAFYPKSRKISVPDFSVNPMLPNKKETSGILPAISRKLHKLYFDLPVFKIFKSNIGWEWEETVPPDINETVYDVEHFAFRKYGIQVDIFCAYCPAIDTLFITDVSIKEEDNDSWRFDKNSERISR